MKKLLLGILGLGLLLAGCQEPVEPVVQKIAGPKLVSCDPADGAQGLTGSELTVKLTFDQNIRCSSVQQKKVSVDGGAVIDKVSAYNAELKISLSGLEDGSGKTYVVNVPDGTVSGFKTNQTDAAGIAISFTMKYVEPYVPSTLDPVKTLTNPNASPQAVNVYNFLLENSGKKTLSGAQSSQSNKNDFVDFIYSKVGRQPALAGYDFIFLQYSPTPEGWSWEQNYNDISAAKEQWEANGLVSYMWHWNVPNSEAAWKAGVDDGDFNGYAFYTEKTSFDIREALKPGTWQNEFIMKDIAEVAGYLQLLEDEGIPVIWRPLHEAAGNYGLYEGGGSGAWFWWGKHGPEPCKQLWKLLYDQLVNVYGLDNLIWVWTVDVAAGHEDRNFEWYPGNDCVDIVGVDIYANDTEAKSLHYQALLDVTKGQKLVTISECGNIPDPVKCMEAGNAWSWFMVWCTSDSDGNLALNNENWSLNTLTHWNRVLGSEYVINREDMPSLK